MHRRRVLDEFITYVGLDVHKDMPGRSFCIPTASIVTIAPFRLSTCNNSGIADSARRAAPAPKPVRRTRHLRAAGPL